MFVAGDFHRTLFISLLIVAAIILTGCTNENSVLRSNNSLGTDDPAATDDISSVQNSVPVLNLSVSQNMVGFNGEVTLLAEAIDPDGDILTFNWLASNGVYLTQIDNQAVWKAPSEMLRAQLACMVEDQKGAKSVASAFIDVIGGRKYSLEIMLDRTSLIAPQTESVNSEWLPLAQAQVTIPSLNNVAVSDASGKVSFDIDSGSSIATAAEVVIQYLDWEIRYKAYFPESGVSVSDSIRFYPGYDGISVAVARGDSFTTRRGGVEVLPVEYSNGEIKLLSEVTVDVGAQQEIARNGPAFLNVNSVNGETNLRLIKSGYESIDGYKIPITIDGLTLVRAKMTTAGGICHSDAFISWLKPFNGEKAFPVTGPFIIGFGQAMEKETIFDDMQLVIQETENRSMAVISGQGVKNAFNIEWDGYLILKLYPKEPLKALKKYSLIVNRWNARALDGRLLKNYSGMFGYFTTDSDNSPMISSTSPQNGSTGVPRSGPFIITFDRPMNRETLFDNLSIEITDMVTNAGISISETGLSSEFDIVWTENDTVLSLVPRKTLKAQHPYLVKLLRSGLKSKSGKSIESLSNLWGQFTTGDI